MKCSICKQKVPELFLSKIKGSYIKDRKGKLHPVCFQCQKSLKTKEEMLEKLS